MVDLDWVFVGRQLIRALRGERSQAAFARRIGVSTQTIANWEAGRRIPSATRVLEAAKVVGADVSGAFDQFDRKLCSVPTDDQDMGEWLTRLTAERTVKQVATRMDVSRYRMSRWMTGDTRVPLPDFLKLIDMLTRRLSDWVAVLVAIDDVPLLAPRHRQRQAARKLAFERPLSEAILRLAETEAYVALQKHVPGWFARRLRVSVTEEVECLSAMVESGLLTRAEGRYQAGAPTSIDTGASFAEMKALKLHWLSEIKRSLEEERPNNAYGYNVISVSHRDLERIRELHLQYFRQLRAIVVESEPVETVALIGMQIVEFPP